MFDLQFSALWFYGYNEVSTMTLKKTVSRLFDDNREWIGDPFSLPSCECIAL
jgi:hypothetical protein